VYLDEAVDSALAQTFGDFEILVVNDGSTDEFTNQLLAGYRRPRTRVIHTENRGLAEARNTGIREAQGEYILPLDADDRIGPEYLEKGVALLDQQPDVGIVYCLAETFGARTGPWPSPSYSLGRMLLGNLIFCSALFRRADWERAGGYNPNMAAGWEDWDFWLSIIGQGRTVRRIPETLFFYRVKEISMARSMDVARKTEMHLRVMGNHPALFVAGCRPLLEWYYRITGSRPYLFLKRLRIPLLVGRVMGRRGDR
jgi:glycosyltransferase involved in cell wall biosynthesis